MLLRFGKRNGIDEEALRDITDDVTESDFIPYAYHFDPDTLLTKNGELMQVIRISTGATGVDYESPEPNVPTLRDAIRKALCDSVHSEKYAFWFHTLRRRVPIAHSPGFPEPFAADLNKAWRAARGWQHSYTNEVYISVLRQGQSSDLFDLRQMANTLAPLHHRRWREAFLDTMKEELDATTQSILNALTPLSNARRLTMMEREGTLYSEPLELLHYLVNLQPAAIPVLPVDASQQLATHEVTFGFDAMESRSRDGKRRFTGLLTLKGALELSPEVLDKCLQLPEEMIVTQSFNYLPKKQALEKYLDARALLEGNPDPLIPTISGLSAMLESDQGNLTDFGEQHSSISIIRDRYKLLDDAIGNVQENFARLGLISVREEIMLEDCYWAQLPGNFPFLRRRVPVATRRLGGLSRLNHFPSGQSTGTHWGAPLALLPTTLGTPYYFNFHVGRVGHTALLDFNSFADERGMALLNFLLAESRQYGGRLIVFDRNHSARPLVRALSGQYYQPLSSDAPCRFNPLQLPDTPRNRAFLASWLSHFITPEAAQEEHVRGLLKGVLDNIYALPQPQRSLAEARRRISAMDSKLLLPAGPALDHLFGGDQDTADFSAAVSAVEMLDVAAHPELVVPLFTYLLHRIVSALDGKPAIIVLNEAWSLLDNPFFSARIGSLLDMLTQHNALMVFTTRHFERHLGSHLTRQILDHTPTKLFIPDDVATDYFTAATGLTEREVKTLVRMERQKGQFLLKHGPEVVECVFPDAGLETFTKILSGDARALRLMRIQQR